jgi:polyferredoxin
LWAWIGIGALQTFVLIPWAVLRWGKGAYCGWICSCGALAETVGDDHRTRMPHGPGWNRANLAGQVLLALAFALLVVRIVGWAVPGDDPAGRVFDTLLLPGWKWIVDVALAGVLGYGAYFWLSGRVWCRFLCPLAAFMHLVARFSRFAIASEAERCISCNRCTTVCHMGIDVMTPAQRGEPMRDPECVRCSACVSECPTGVLSFATVGRDGFVSLDTLAASPVRMREDRERDRA